MIEVIVRKTEVSEVLLDDVGEERPIFIKDKDGSFCGMVINDDEKGWIARLGGTMGANGYHSTRRKCLQSCLQYGYTYFVD